MRRRARGLRSSHHQPQNHNQTRLISELRSRPIIGAATNFNNFENRGASNISLVLTDSTYIQASLGTQADSAKLLRIDHFYVDRLARYTGIGRRLAEAMLKQVIDMGATELWSHSTPNDALALAARIVGEENMQFYDYDHPEAGFLPMSLEQSMRSNDRLNEYIIKAGLTNSRLQPQQMGLMVDLTIVDTSQMQGPDCMVTIVKDGKTVVNTG